MLKLNDYLLLTASLVLFFASGYFFFKKEYTLSGREELKSIGIVNTVKFNVKRKMQNSMAWNDLSLSEEIYDKDKIFTDNNSTVQIGFYDKSSLELPPNSLMVIERGKDSLDIDLKDGLLNLDLNEKQKSVNLKVGTDKLSIESTNAKIQVAIDGGNKSDMSGISGTGQKNASNSDKRANVTVLNGSAVISFRGKELTVNQYEKVVLDEKTNRFKKAEVIISLQTPLLSQKIFFKKDESLGFSWVTKAQVDEFKFVVGSDPQLKNIIIEREVSMMETTAILPEMGSYYWKVYCLYKGAITSSPVYQFSLVDDIPPHLLYPEPKSYVYLGLTAKTKNVQLRWEPQDVNEYEIDFFYNYDGKDGSKLIKTKESTFIVEDLPLGDYQWRVRAVDPRRPNSAFSESRFFSIIEWKNETSGKRVSEPDFKKFKWP